MNNFADVLQFSQESQARQVDNMLMPTVMLADHSICKIDSAIDSFDNH